MGNELEECFPLGHFIAEELQARGWTPMNLAIRMWTHELQIDALAIEFLIACPGVRIDDDSAERMAKALGVDKEFLLNLEKQYSECKAEGRAE